MPGMMDTILNVGLNGAPSLRAYPSESMCDFPPRPCMVELRICIHASTRSHQPHCLDATVEGLVKLTGDGRFAYDSYRRLIQVSPSCLHMWSLTSDTFSLQMYADIVLGVEHHDFEVALESAKKKVFSASCVNKNIRVVVAHRFV